MKDNFVDKGMCADFAIHDKGTGNPHVHIMLTLRPLKENGQWGAKCRKAYDLDENGQRIPDGKGGWKNHREDTTDWNDKENVEIWRAAWAAYTNRALESAGRPERIDHRSYKRQGIDKIPSVHLGPAASQMEKRGIRTDKGEVNRQIVADNKLLKEIKARITRLYRWSKAETEKPQTQQSSLTALWEAQHRHESYAGGAKSCGTAPQGRRPTGPAGTGQAPRPGAGAVKGTALCRPLSGASRFTTPFCTQKNRRTGFPIRRQMVYLPNKSLCDPVRASVSTSTSSSIR